MTRHRFGFSSAFCGQTARFASYLEEESGDKSPQSKNQQAASAACFLSSGTRSFRNEPECSECRCPDRSTSLHCRYLETRVNIVTLNSIHKPRRPTAMNLSLSVRIAEGFLSKEVAELDLRELCALANRAGYDSLCMRASQVGVHSQPQAIEEAALTIESAHLSVSMVTGNFDIVYNNEAGPECLRDITPHLHLAKSLGAPMIRVALKQERDIVRAQRAADQAREFGLKLVHQCHTLSRFETVDDIESTLRAVDRDNFGLIFEPANLEICGQDYGPGTIEQLAPWIFNVYFQNQQLKPDGDVTLDTWCRGPVSFDLIQIHDRGGIDFDTVFAGLHKIGYDGTVTVHQSAGGGQTPAESAAATAQFLRSYL
jgi:sugar phosphate isomerase/epimerase